MARDRPLGRKAYGSIPHLPGSRLGAADRSLPAALARVCTEAPRDARDHIIVQEKLDGSCVAAARIGDEIVALGRAGDLAERSANEGRRRWAAFVLSQRERFLAVLAPGERLVGEWLALAHSTRYALPHEPFVCFDLMQGSERAPLHALVARVAPAGFVTPGLLHEGAPLSIDDAMARLGRGFHGAIDPVEGAVWRVERHEDGRASVDFVAKYVRRDKVDGALLPEATGGAAIWNSGPGSASLNGSPEDSGSWP